MKISDNPGTPDPLSALSELPALRVKRARVDALLAAEERAALDFWSPDVSRTVYVPVEDGEIRVLHIRPENPVAVRPIVLVPGWGSLPSGFGLGNPP